MSSVSQIYKRTEVVGRGKFGIVYKGIHRSTKKVYAIKVLNLDTTEDEVKDVQQEIQFLSNLKHVPNVTHYYGSYLNGTKLWIIMDFCAGGSLRTLLKPGRLDEKYIGVIVREVLTALQFIHKQNVIHRDIKAANVLITNEGKVQLCDFGVAAQLTATSSRRNTMAGTPYWMAPEVILEGTSYDVKADIWSLGITIYEIATGNPPYCDKEAMRAMQLITKSKPPRLDGKQYSALLKEVIALCLDENPQERLGAEELLKCKFVKFHKNSPTSCLREIISRYLLWREKKSSRESILLNVEDDGEENEVEVKWDFDSLSSNEYILENDININNINLNDNDGNENEYTFESGDYDDGVDEFMTGYRNRDHYDHVPYGTTINNSKNTSNITYNKNTATYNVASTLKANGTMNRKEAPKSLLQLFQEGGDEDDEIDHNHDQHHAYELPKISSAVGLHNLPTSSEISTTRVGTPIKEIEIPDFEDIETLPSNTQTLPELKARSRANTLLHTQSATVLETRKILDPSIQRRPTLSNSGVSTAALPSQIQPQQQQLAQAANIIQNTSLPANTSRATPSPKRELNVITSPVKQSVTSSPSKNISSSSNVSMKAIPSPSNPSPLLQPLNAITSQPSSSSVPLQTKTSEQQQQQQQQQHEFKRNYQNLRLQMPTPTVTTFPKLLHNGSNLEDNDENVNQFGVNVSHLPMAMTPLTEKAPTMQPQGSGAMTVVPKRKHTMTSMSQPPSMPFINNSQRATSSLSSHSSADGANTTTNTSCSVESNIIVPGLDISLFIDAEYSKENMNTEMSTLLASFARVLGLMEERLNALNE